MTTDIYTAKGNFPVTIVPISGQDRDELCYGVTLMGESFMMRYNFDDGRFYPVLPVPIEEHIIGQLSDIIERQEQ